MTRPFEEREMLRASRWLLVISVLAFWAAPTVHGADAADLRDNACKQALDQLLKRVRTIRIDGNDLLGGLLDGIGQPVTWETLMGGTEIELPVRYFGTG